MEQTITLSARLRRAFEPRFVRRVFRTALPIAAQFLIASAVNLIDVVMIGRLGGDAVAAAGGGNQIFFLLTMVLFGINSGGSVFLSQFWGTQDLKNVRRTMGMMYLLGAAVTLFFTVGALAAPRLLVSFYVHEEPALTLAADYLFWVGLSYPMTAVSLILSMVCRCTGSLHLPTLASTLSILVNVGGNALLIYGLLGCPALGLRGAAIATTLARLVECLVLVTAIYRRKLAGAARPKELFALDGNFVRKYLRTAWPVLLNETLWSVGFSLYTVAYGLLGTAALAAVQISGTVIQLMTVFTRGMSNACGIFIGNMVGAGDEEGALDYGHRFALLLPAVGLVTGLICIALSPLFLRLYSVSEEILSLARIMLILQALSTPLKCNSMVLIVGVFRAAGDTLHACLIDNGSVWLAGVPMAFLGVWLGLPVWGVFLMICCDDIAKNIASLLHLRREKWIRNVSAQLQ